jgi:hypothetical protein
MTIYGNANPTRLPGQPPTMPMIHITFGVGFCIKQPTMRYPNFDVIFSM